MLWNGIDSFVDGPVLRDVCRNLSQFKSEIEHDLENYILLATKQQYNFERFKTRKFVFDLYNEGNYDSCWIPDFSLRCK